MHLIVYIWRFVPRDLLKCDPPSVISLISLSYLTGLIILKYEANFQFIWRGLTQHKVLIISYLVLRCHKDMLQNRKNQQKIVTKPPTLLLVIYHAAHFRALIVLILFIRLTWHVPPSTKDCLLEVHLWMHDVQECFQNFNQISLNYAMLILGFHLQIVLSKIIMQWMGGSGSLTTWYILIKAPQLSSWRSFG